MAFGNKNVVAATFVAKDDASKTVNSLRGNMKALGSKTGGPLGGVIGGFAAMPGPALLAGAAIGAATAFLAGATKAAIDEEKGIARLDTALEANVTAWDGNRDAIEGVIAEREKLAFSDGEQRDSLSKLIPITKDVNAALDLQRQAMDLARAKGMSLADASTLLGKVYSGNVGILKRYGIQVEAGATSTEALAAIQEQTAGQAEAFANTTEGAMQSMNLAIDNVSEDIGAMLLPVLKDIAIVVRDEIVPAIRGMGEAFGWAAEQWNQLNRLKNPIEAWASDARAAMESTATAAGVSASQLAAALRQTGNTLPARVEEWEAMKDEVIAAAHAMAAESGREARRGMALVRQGFNAGAPGITAAAHAAFESVLVEVQRVIDAARGRGRRIAGELAGGMRDRRSAIRDEAVAFKAAMENPISRSEEIAWAKGQLFGDRLARGMRSKNPYVRDASQQYRQSLLSYLADTYALGHGRGVLFGNGFTNGLNSSVPNRYRGGATPRATGGAVWGNDTFLVGESGPELLMTGPGFRGKVDASPNFSTGGGPNVTQIYLDGRLIYEVVNERTGRQLALDRSSTRTARN